MAAGWKIKCSLVEQDDSYKMRFSYKDTDGIAVSQEATGNDPEEVVYQLANDAIADIIAQQKILDEVPEEKEEEKEVKEPEHDETYIAQLEKLIEDLTYENNSLKTDLDILQRRADDVVNKSIQEKEEKEKNDKKIVNENLFKDAEKWFEDFDYTPLRYFRFKKF